jgi:hypothetical protein
MAEFIWEATGIVLFDREINRLLNVLEGKAWQDHHSDPPVDDAVEQDPLFEALSIFLHDRTFNGKSTKLLTELRKVAKLQGVDVLANAWPKGPAQLSRRIAELAPLLSKAGVMVEIGRKAQARFIKLSTEKPCDDAGGQPSQSTSLDKSHHPQTLQRPNDGDAEGRLQHFNRIRGSRDP